METIMQYIPLAVSAILLAALILTVITNIIVQVAKQMTWGKIPPTSWHLLWPCL